MPSSRILISSQVLTGTASTVTFSSIPSTYKDLSLKWSVRDSNASLVANSFIYYNGNSSTTSYSQTYFRGGNSSGTSSTRNSSDNDIYLGYNNGSTSTANTFSSGELYIPNYALTSTRPMSSFLAQEENSTSSGWMHINSGVYIGTDAITSITLTASVNFLAGSSFYLYGINN
jgi:hypothetical protein